MFKKFEEKEHVSNVNNMKTSVQRAVRAKVLESYASVEPYIDQILPKKETLKLIKCHEHVEIISNPDGQFLFFRQRDGPWCPTLRLLHKYPFMLPHQQVDKGAIRFVLSGANIMCPGLTSPGARMTPELGENTVVAVMAEGKQHAMAIGKMAMTSSQIAEKNKGIGVENLHYLNDGLWTMKPVK